MASDVRMNYLLIENEKKKNKNQYSDRNRVFVQFIVMGRDENYRFEMI